LLNPN
jgi:intraflagellar transport protein 52